jgi:hypothetical protein
MQFPLRGLARRPHRKAQETTCGVVVQLVRTPACHAGGRGFESRRPRQNFMIHQPPFGGFLFLRRRQARKRPRSRCAICPAPNCDRRDPSRNLPVPLRTMEIGPANTASPTRAGVGARRVPDRAFAGSGDDACAADDRRRSARGDPASASSYTNAHATSGTGYLPKREEHHDPLLRDRRRRGGADEWK